MQMSGTSLRANGRARHMHSTRYVCESLSARIIEAALAALPSARFCHSSRTSCATAPQCEAGGPQRHRAYHVLGRRARVASF